MKRLFCRSKDFRTTSVWMFSVFLAACEVGEIAPGGEIADGSPEQPISHLQKVSLLNASADELASYVVDCISGKPTQVCVLICHRPPGNPLNAKSLVLPLKASLKHLDHGNNESQPDYLGSCEESGPPEEFGDGSDAEIVDDDSDGGELVVDGTLPEWCLENIAIDSDCDGVDDHSGEPLY